MIHDPYLAKLAEAADTVLGLLLWTQVSYLPLSRVPTALRSLAGKGLTLGEPDDPDDPSESASMKAVEEHTRISVDVRTVLQEILAPLGLTPGSQRDAFLSLEGSAVPSRCELFFLMDNHVPPYTARALSEAALCVVFHTNADVPNDYNTFVNALGVHVLRLKDLGRIDLPALTEHASGVEEIRNNPRSQRL